MMPREVTWQRETIALSRMTARDDRMDNPLSGLLNLHDFEEAARPRLSPLAWHYTAGGSEDETSLRANRSAHTQWRLLPRILRGAASVSTATELLGHRLALPVLLAPTGRHGLAHEEGERATARAARAAGTIYIMSSVTTVPMEEIAAECGPWWLQLYVFRDRERTREQVLRAAAAGASALVLTVDAQVRGRREAEERASLMLPPSEPGPDGRVQARSPLARQIASLFDLSLAWSDIDWLTSLAGLPVVVKGIVHPADALQAMAHGAQAILVSNHGGRQLDGVVAGLDALPAVVAAVQGRVPVLVDGGVRRGTDILIALALGAQAVLLGRPVHWGLAVGGEAGVRQVLELLQTELERDLTLCGLANVGEVTRDLIVPAPGMLRTM
jgi:4-hydroxymandelate oxidase